MPEHIRLLRPPDGRGEKPRLLVLIHTARIGGNPVARTARPLHEQQIVHPVPHRFRRKPQLPDAVLQPVQPILRQLAPIRKIAEQRNAHGVGRPFAEHPFTVAEMQPEILVAGGELRQRGLPAGQPLHGRDGPAAPLPEFLPERRQPGIGVQRHRFIAERQKLHCTPPSAVQCCTNGRDSMVS